MTLIIGDNSTVKPFKMNWITGLSREENDDVADKECKVRERKRSSVYFSMRGMSEE